MDWIEEPARCSPKDRNTHRVTDPKFDMPTRSPIRLYIADIARARGLDINELRGPAYQSIRQTVRIVRVPAAVDLANRRPRSRHDGAPAADHGQNARHCCG